MVQLSDDVLQQLLERCVEERSGEFGGFYRPFLAECAQEIRAWGRSGEAGHSGFVDLPQIADTLLRAVMDAYCRTGVRTLISAFRSRESDPACVAMGYDEFHTWLSGVEGRKRLLGLYPELDRLLRLSADRNLAHAQQVLHAAWQDRAELGAAYGTDGPIVSLVPGLGDSHRGGRTVSSLRWHNGVTVIHKPQQESAQPLLEAVRDLTDRDGAFFGPLVPRAIVRPAYLWQECVRHGEVDETLGAAGYFRRFGRAAALLSMMGATDLHHENVLATPGGPVVIDTETLVSLPGHHGTGGAGALGRETEASVLNTMLFSTRFSGAALDVDMSAVGCIRPADSRRLRTHRVVDAGTDRIRFDQVPAGAPHGSNMATVAGEPLDPRLWSDQITAGFHEARERLRTHREAIEDTVERHRGWSVRQVLRPTYVYARFLDASTHPAYLSSTATRTDLLSKMPRRHRGVVGMEAGEALRHAEAAQLVDLDIPFFDVPCDARALRGNHGEPITTASHGTADVGSTPREAVQRAVRDFFERPAVRDLAYIGYALGSSVDDVWEESRTPVHGSGCPGLADASGWHTMLAELVVSQDEQPTWLMPKLDGDGLRLGSVNAPLYEGGGLMLYLAEAGRADGAQVIGADPGAAYAAAMPRELPETTAPMDFSPFTGALSSVVTGLELVRRGVDPYRIPLPDLPVGDLDVRGLTVKDFDYLNGFGGYLLYRAEYADEARLPATGPDTGLLLDRLVELDGPPDAHQGPLGLAHGRFGRIAAMSALVLRGADPSGRVVEHLAALASSYRRHRWTDEALRDARSTGGWCKGYAGVAFAAAKLLRAVGCSDEQTREAIAPEVERVITGDLRPDISFCHGTAGRLAMLCWLADHLDWPQLRSEAVALSDRFLDRYGHGSWTFGIGSVTDLPSFLYGRSGWYYTQLMLRDESVRLPLCLGGR
ncbi:type 2 lanthipeptide synthetase LanM [Streptomyces erythrochromogenes]|uniref:type 2 lanthipeptide synthetase LanM n=1 Tax=Streptomyces erythrochromogenes TaxID=285574 RepID=UPI00363B77C4